MEYKAITLDEEVLRMTAPAHIPEMMKDNRYEIAFYGGFEEDALVCYAVFSHLPERDVFLEHLYTVPERRGEGRCGELLAFCKKHLKELGSEALIAKNQLQPEYAVEYNEFMQKQGFLPLNLTDRLLLYRLVDLERPGSMQMVLDNMDRLPPVLDLKQAGEARVREFLKDMGQTETALAEKDQLYSRFFLNGKKVSGALIASALDEDTLLISGVYLDDLAKQNNMFLEIFSASLDAAKKDLGEDMTIYFLVGDEDTYEGLLRVFLPPQEEYLVMEHMMPLTF